MHSARVLKAPAQDVCLFCAFRASSVSRAPAARRRLLHTSRVYRQQPAFAEAEEEESFGSLGDQYEANQPKPPPSKAQEVNRDPGRYGERARSNRVAPQQWGNRNQRSEQPIIRRINLDFPEQGRRAPPGTIGPSQFSTPEQNVDPQLASKWAIGQRRQPPATSQTTSDSLHGEQPTFRIRRQSPPTSQTESDSLDGQQPTFRIRRHVVAPDPGRLAQHTPFPARDEPTARQAWSPSFQDEAPEALDWAPAKQTKAAPKPTSTSSTDAGAYGSAPRKSEASSESGATGGYGYGYGYGDGSQSSRQNTFQDVPERRGRRARDRDFEGDDKRGKNRGRASRDDEDPDFDREDYHRRKKERQARARSEVRQKEYEESLQIKLPDFITVGNLATQLQLRYSQFAKILNKFGFDDTNSDYILSADNAALIVEEAGYVPITESHVPDEDLVAAPLPEDISELPQRPPVVTIMGHVDHGKTTILDYMRKSSIVASEHGGITQHIGAFSVPMPSGKTITFLDTPGHAAFLSMRQRGANVTDIVVLVVAADDSVMPQTLEAIKHAKAANVPIIVALNKIDKPEAKPDSVKQDLARHGVEIEDYGGDVQVVQVSGKTGKGMSDLEESIVALSEIQDQRAPTDGAVEGWVLESATKEAGKVATVLIRRGTLRIGDILVAGTEYCRVRSMRDEFGKQVDSVGPGMPVAVEGWRGQANAGDEVLQAPNEQVAHRVTNLRASKLSRVDLIKDVDAMNEIRRAQLARHERERAIEKAKRQGVELPPEVVEDQVTGGPKKVYFIVKGDVAGSVEAVVNAVATVGNSEVQAVVLRSGVGAISEFDIDHATAAGGHVVSFNLPIPPTMRGLAERAGTKIMDNNVIYRLVNDVKTALEEKLEPVIKSKVLGEAEIAQVFEIKLAGKKTSKIAGCKIRNGTVTRNAKIRVVRGAGGDIVFTGSLSSLKNVKKDVTEMPKGSECGMGFLEWQDFQVGDLAQCIEEWEERRSL